MVFFIVVLGIAAAAKLLQLCLTLCDPKDSIPPGYPILGILQARILKWGCHFLLKGIFPTQGSNSHLLHWQVDSLPLSHEGSTHLFISVFIFIILGCGSKRILLLLLSHFSHVQLCATP